MGEGTRSAITKVAYVCDGGAKLGLGHISRGRALLAHIPGHFLVPTGPAQSVLTKFGVAAVPWESESSPFDPSRPRDHVVVVDHYGLPESWIESAGRTGPVVVVDDWKRPSTGAHLIINPNVGARPAFYPGRSADTCLCGREYAMIRPEVARHVGPRPTGPIEGRVVVTLGGGESALDWTVVVRELLARVGCAVRTVDVVIGPAARSAELPPDLRAAGVALHQQTPDFARLCLAADIVVCSASTTSHEMAYLGVAFVPVVTVDNQDHIGRGWEEAGVAPYLTIEDRDFHTQLAAQVETILSSQDGRDMRAAAGRAVVDGAGARRITEALRAWPALPRDSR